ncbi:MAG: nitronate monooxygenase [Dehalococcoidia bacterium]|nr:nitronate monooxygenase [Dehalococcoidia bacterium]
MKRTKVSDILDIQYPIVQAPMGWISGAELVAAVSNAGGMGTIGPGVGQEVVSRDPKVVGEILRREIRQTQELTSRPFAVNCPIGRRGKAVCDRRLEVCIEEGVKVAVVSMGSPDEYTKQMHDAGMKVIHVVGSSRHALRAQQSGVDIVVAQGHEAGGHSSPDEIPSLVLVPQVVDAVNIPVLAAGGIGDARGVVAALALGAEGVYMGTRFMPTLECTCHPAVKEAIVNSRDDSYVAYGRRVYSITRSIKNEFTKKFLEMEFAGVPAEELRAFDRYYDPGDDDRHRMIRGLKDGEMEWGAVPMGPIGGLVTEITSATDVMKDLIEGYDKVVAGLKG